MSASTNLLQTAIDQLVGTGNHRAVSSRNESLRGDLPATVMVSLNPSNSTKNDLASQGYTNTRVFFSYPPLLLRAGSSLWETVVAHMRGSRFTSPMRKLRGS